MVFHNVNAFLSGTLTMAFFTAALYFFRFWRTTRDRFFLIFGLAWAMMGAERIIFVLSHIRSDEPSMVYLIRLTSFLMIIMAVLDKNRR